MAAPQPVIVAPWSGDALATTWISDVAPAASVELLVTANLHVLRAITAPYAVAGLTFEANNTAGTRWHYAQRINMGTRSMQGWFFLGLVPDPSMSEPANVSLYTSSSGATANDEITVPVGVEGAAAYNPMGPIPAYPKSSLEEDASPTAAMDRRCELYIQDAHGTAVSSATDKPYTEGFEVANTHGVSGIVDWVADVSTL